MWIAKITLAEDENKHNKLLHTLHTLHIVLFSLIFKFNVVIGTFFVYYKYMDHV